MRTSELQEEARTHNREVCSYIWAALWSSCGVMTLAVYRGAKGISVGSWDMEIGRTGRESKVLRGANKRIKAARRVGGRQ